MIVSITKIQLKSISTLFSFFKMNSQIINELKQSQCRKFKTSGSLNLKNWYTMTLWESENDLNAFYRSGKHLEAMKRSKIFSSGIQSRRIEKEDLLNWSEAKKFFT